MLGSGPIDSSADVIDSREVIARIEWLDDDDYERDADEAAELVALRALAAEAEGINSNWRDGLPLVDDGYFAAHIKDETQELYGEIYGDRTPYGEVPSVRVDWSAFPFNHIDWDAVAEDAKRHHSSLTFDGRLFWLADE